MKFKKQTSEQFLMREVILYSQSTNNYVLNIQNLSSAPIGRFNQMKLWLGCAQQGYGCCQDTIVITQKETHRYTHTATHTHTHTHTISIQTHIDMKMLKHQTAVKFKIMNKRKGYIYIQVHT